MKTPENDTITAIITPPGEGGIAVIRLSGPDSLSIAGEVFRGRVNPADAKHQTVHYGKIVDADDTLVDEVLVTVFRTPHSYTTEDVVEISCHGSLFIARKIVELLVKKGARPAGPGEFTRRAFLNGRIDLSQAEAVADLIRAGSTASHNLALAQLRGTLSGKVGELRQRIVDLCSMIELELDFSEEGLELIERKKLLTDLSEIRTEITHLIDSYEHGKVYRDGLRIVLAGPPNVGKSSILNSLIKENRAIVTDISGTTRDTIEEAFILDGVRLNIVDTAGLRETSDVIEAEGIKRTREEISHADLILLVIDPSVPLHVDKDVQAIDSYLDSEGKKEYILVFNKVDLLKTSDIANLEERFRGYSKVFTSTKSGAGMRQLEELIKDHALPERGAERGESLIVSNIRQKDRLEKALNSIDLAVQGVDSGVSGDLIAIDLKGALSSLSEVVGVDVSDEVLNNIFLRFCIGK